MNSFTLHIPTRVFFGSDQVFSFADATVHLGKHAFVVTGGGSVQRLGYLDIVSKALAAAGLKVSHFSGVEPNPDAATINRAAAHMRAAEADFVVALGGGSVIDASKAIAALVHDGEDDIWPFVHSEARAGQLKGALPVVAIPTTAATASEVTPYAVISNRAVRGKANLTAEFNKPRLAWLNPAFTTELPAQTTRDGAADIISHVLENYLLGGNGSPLADRHAEGVIATVLESLPRALLKPTDLAVRGNLLWASTLALGGLEVAGRRASQYPLHAMEHGLSAYRPELAHGRGLATLHPAYFRWLLASNRAVDRLAQLGSRLFGLTGEDSVCAAGFIESFEQWLMASGLWQSLSDLGFTESELEQVADYVVRIYGDGSQLDALGAMPRAAVLALFKSTERQSRRTR